MKIDTKKLRELADAATKGPWVAKNGEVTTEADVIAYCVFHYLSRRGSDAAFIAAAREAVPALCDEVDKRGWVPVAERLPSMPGYYPVHTSLAVSFRFWHGRKWEQIGKVKETVHAWFDLPEPPEVER